VKWIDRRRKEISLFSFYLKCEVDLKKKLKKKKKVNLFNEIKSELFLMESLNVNNFNFFLHRVFFKTHPNENSAKHYLTQYLNRFFFLLKIQTLITHSFLLIN